MINRRAVTKGMAGAGLAALTSRWALGGADTGSPSPVVKTNSGPIRGMARNGLCVFLGVPYGAPTGATTALGASRFMAPRPPAPWTSVRDTRAYGDSCPQLPFGGSPFAKALAPGEAPPPPTPMQRQVASLFPRNGISEGQQSEDCLVLNVWTPALDSAKRPVMVWLHGGGFGVGSGSGSIFDGTRLAVRGNVVVVTINHRLNAFGYLYLGDLAGERFAQSGNVGMLDIVAALEWVRDNVADFGGDPGNVTLFGESGGAGKVSVMCAMPAAKGLFHKAIMQSGPCLKISDKERGTAIAKQLLRDLGLSMQDVAQLQNIDAAKLAAAADAAERKVVPRILGAGPMGLIPLVDGIVLHHDPFDSVAAPESANVPFLVGSTKDEAILFIGPFPNWGHFTEAQLLQMVRPIAGARAQQALDLYRTLRPSDSPSYRFADLLTDVWIRQAANRVAELKVAQGGAPAYVYVLEWPINPVLRTPHVTDVPLVFDNIGTAPGIAAAPGAQAVADQMSAAWIAFAGSGNPNTPKIPHWPPYSLPARSNMLFNLRSHIVEDYGKQAREFWEAT